MLVRKIVNMKPGGDSTGWSSELGPTGSFAAICLMPAIKLTHCALTRAVGDVAPE
jgi:hypothetical protein